MNKLAVGAIVAAATCLGASAQAADFGYGRQPAPYYTVNQPLNMYSWAGPYLGANIGYGWGDVTNSGVNPSGVAGGIQAGYNWQSGPLVFGVEGDLQASGADDTFAAWKFSNPWFGTARGRIGYALNNILIYATGGLAFGSLKYENNIINETHSSLGWTLGAGAEMALSQNWSAKAEYLYVDLSNRTFLTGLQHGYEFGLLRVGVNYHF